MRQDALKPLLLIAIPTRGMNSFYFSQDLAGAIYPSNFSLAQLYLPFMEVGKARNLAVHKAKAMGAKYLVFRDEDVIAGANAVKQLHWHMANHPEWSVCAGLYATKSYPPEPLLYTEWGQGANYDWKEGDLKRVLFTGMGIAMLRVSDFDLLDAPTYEERDPETGAPLQIKEYFKTIEMTASENSHSRYGSTEDAAFFEKLEAAGLQAWVDTGLLCKHFDDKTWTFFSVPTKGKPDAWNNTPRTLNLGAGGEYDPYEISVDLRDEPNITYKRDIRNLPEDWKEQFDLVKASHVLEHFGYEQTQAILSEWARVVKPGGMLQIIVPDMQAFAEQIVSAADGEAGYVDLPILGGIFGDQGHPYWRQDAYGGEHGGRFLKESFENNHHRTGFTARSLGGAMQAVGLELVRLERAANQILCEARKPERNDHAEEKGTDGTGGGGDEGISLHTGASLVSRGRKRRQQTTT